MKTTKGGKVMNPTDAYRKELRKKELKRNKRERKKVREVGILKKDPEVIREQIEKLEKMKADGALDKARKHKKRQLEDTLTMVIKKRKEYEDKMKEKGETPVMFSHLAPPRRRTDEEDNARHPKPEDSVYYHPTLNPTGAPPPGKPPMYKSSIGPRIPLSAASSSADASSSRTESEDAAPFPPPPPPPPPLPEGNELVSGDIAALSASVPLPPPPPMPPKPAESGLPVSLPPPPLPPAPPGPPPKEHVAIHSILPPPPPLQQSAPPPPPGSNESEMEKSSSASSDEPSSKDSAQVPSVLPAPPPPPPGMPGNQLESGSSEVGVDNPSVMMVNSKLVPPPPPPRQQPQVPGANIMPNMQSDMLPPGMSRFPPPPPPNMRHPLPPPPGIPGQVPPPGVMVPLMPMPPYGPLPGPPPMMRPPLPPGPPPNSQEDAALRPQVPQKPSYVKSAAPTVVKRPLAQHTPELTAMVPASVRVRRESAAPKTKPKPTSSVTAVAHKPAAPVPTKLDSTNSSTAPKTQSIDDSYTAFLEDMKALGALDS